MFLAAPNLPMDPAVPMDLSLAMAVMAFLSVIAGVLAYLGLRGRSDRVGPLLLILMLATAVGFTFGLKDRLLWAHFIPVSAALIYSNALPILLGVAAGLAACLANRPPFRRWLGGVSLSMLAILSLVQPVLQPVLRPIEGSDRWSHDGVALQTRAHTCSAAAGATLLHEVGIEISEQKMVEFCLTDARGTPSLGLWRGLCLATKGTGYRPRATDKSANALMNTGPFPSVVVVGLPPGEVDSKYIEVYGWAEGFRHSVVLLGHQADTSLVVIADPAYGKETWSEEDFRVLYRGEAIHLESKE